MSVVVVPSLEVGVEAIEIVLALRIFEAVA